jgi:hypothetical protein
MAYDGKAIAFERDFGVWTLDVALGKANEVPITLRGASATSGSEHVTISNGFQSLALSPDNKKIAFLARGEVFAASARDGGDATRITTTPEEEAELTWAPDSRRLAYVSSREGAAHIYMYDFATRAETKLTGLGAEAKYDVEPTARRSRSCAARRSCASSTSRRNKSAYSQPASSIGHRFCPIMPSSGHPTESGSRISPAVKGSHLTILILFL